MQRTRVILYLSAWGAVACVRTKIVASVGRIGHLCYNNQMQMTVT